MERAGEPRRLMAVCVTLGAVAQILQVLTQIPPPDSSHGYKKKYDTIGRCTGTIA